MDMTTAEGAVDVLNAHQAALAQAYQDAETGVKGLPGWLPVTAVYEHEGTRVSRAVHWCKCVDATPTRRGGIVQCSYPVAGRFSARWVLRDHMKREVRSAEAPEWFLLDAMRDADHVLGLTAPALPPPVFSGELHLAERWDPVVRVRTAGIRYLKITDRRIYLVGMDGESTAVRESLADVLAAFGCGLDGQPRAVTVGADDDPV